jgi:hypothetical protein
LSHFSLWNPSLQNSWKLDAIWESSQLLGMTSQSSWLHSAQFLALDVKYEWAKIILVNGSLCPKLQHYETCKFSWKKSEASTLDPSGHIEDYIT